MKRTTSLKRGRRRTLTAEEREQAWQFREAGMAQWCASCGGHHGHAEVHHVVEKQELKKRKLPLYDPRNALAMCADCHERHTNGSKRIPWRKLRAENVGYAFEVLGDYAGDYLKRRYPMDETEEQL